MFGSLFTQPIISVRTLSGILFPCGTGYDVASTGSDGIFPDGRTEMSSNDVRCGPIRESDRITEKSTP